jgi:hypothetical protein
MIAVQALDKRLPPFESRRLITTLHLIHFVGIYFPTISMATNYGFSKHQQTLMLTHILIVFVFSFVQRASKLALIPMLQIAVWHFPIA